MTDEERLAALSRSALPGPWIRKWESFDVHWIGGFGALRSQEDIDFAVACVNYVRERVLPAPPSLQSKTWKWSPETGWETTEGDPVPHVEIKGTIPPLPPANPSLMGTVWRGGYVPDKPTPR